MEKELRMDVTRAVIIVLSVPMKTGGISLSQLSPVAEKVPPTRSTQSTFDERRLRYLGGEASVAYAAFEWPLLRVAPVMDLQRGVARKCFVADITRGVSTHCNRS